MPMRYYRLTVVGCALSWFLVGLHMPALHQMTHHGRAPHWPVLAAVSFVALVAVAGLVALLRAPGRPRAGAAAP
ncbi:MAG: hypothetical protein ACJ79S_06930 [Gemmatimonadaceae bacterium]